MEYIHISIQIWYRHLLCKVGGNPCCSKIENGSPENEFIINGDSSHQSQNAQNVEMNCHYNSSLPIIIQGESE